MKISFDFDSCLSTKRIQQLLSIMDRDRVEVFIITSRDEFVNNGDLLAVAEGYNIRNLCFTNGMPKSTVCNQLGIDIHFDDMPDEIAHIQAACPKTLGILVTTNIFGDMNYLNDFFPLPLSSIQYNNPEFD